MSDLISRQDAIDACRSVADDINSPTDQQIGAEYCFDLINEIPSAEPERKKGEWSNYKDEHCCSVCKCVVISECWDDDIRYDYCPYCGAEME